MKIYRTAQAFVAAAFAVMLLAGCGTTVEQGEVEQAANPVKQMHDEVSRKLRSDGFKTDWYSYSDALTKARQDNKYAMVVFYASWCKWCKKFEGETLTDPQVAAALKDGFACAKLDAESSEKVVHEMRQMPAYELADMYGVESYPTIVFIGQDGRKVKTLNGYLEPEDFLKYLGYIESGEYKNREF